MNYAVVLSPRATQQYTHLPPELVSEVEAALLRLGGNPTGLSVRIASPPFPPRGQLYHFQLPHAGDSEWFFTVIFRYSQDETELHVMSIMWREVEIED